MADRLDRELFEAVKTGDDAAFERIYDRYQQQARLIAWRISHRPDWVDDLLNEAWCRAFRQRKTYNPNHAFPVWMAGILQNVYREHCRKSPTTLDGDPNDPASPLAKVDARAPEQIAAEAELLAELHDCINRLNPEDARIVRMRFFEEMTLRAVAAAISLPESTIRELRLPSAYKALRQCLARKGVRFSELFPAHGDVESQ